MKSGRQPTFIIGGTLPAGTGQLYSILLQHPEIYLPLPMAPECNFFYKTGDFEKGFSYYLEKYFSKVRNERAIGERSSLLLSGARWTAERVHTYLPDVKLIFMVRNPVDRAFANYRFTALSGFETLSFEDALENESQRLSAESDPFFKELEIYSYFKRGLYYEQVAEFKKRFSPEKLLLIRSDALLKDYESTLQRILSFLGVDDSLRLPVKSDFSSPHVMDLVKQRDLRLQFPSEFAASVQRIREKLPLETECDRLMFQNVSFAKSDMNPATKAMLYQKYRIPNEKFRNLIDFNIDDWFQ